MCLCVCVCVLSVCVLSVDDVQSCQMVMRCEIAFISKHCQEHTLLCPYNVIAYRCVMCSHAR